MKNKSALNLAGTLSCARKKKKKVSTEKQKSDTIQKITLRRYPNPICEEFLFRITPQLIKKMSTLDEVIIYFSGWALVRPGYYKLTSWGKQSCIIDTPTVGTLEVATSTIYLTQELYSLYQRGIPFVYREDKTSQGDDNIIVEILQKERREQLDINRFELPD